MCNAWNHPPGCTCGWGGVYYAHAHSAGHATSQCPSWYLGYTRYSSYVNPNARCPVCGDPVFFYQSPNGGRVFFDELGPPWPKHPCTDHRKSQTIAMAPVAPAPGLHGSNAVAPTARLRDGWEPLLGIFQSPTTDPRVTRISGTAGAIKVSGYIGHERLDPGAPWVARQFPDGRIFVSTIAAKEGHIINYELPLFSQFEKARAWATRHAYGTGVLLRAIGPHRPARLIPRSRPERLPKRKRERPQQVQITNVNTPLPSESESHMHAALLSKYWVFRRYHPLIENIARQILDHHPGTDQGVLTRALHLHRASNRYLRNAKRKHVQYDLFGNASYLSIEPPKQSMEEKRG